MIFVVTMHLSISVFRLSSVKFEEVILDFIEGDEMATKVYNSYVAFKDQVVNYHRISEKAYIDTRELD